jgi:DNA polymerase sigma
MTLHNFLPMHNSSLIQRYIANNPRIFTFLLAIKYWSRQRQLVYSLHHNGVLTSYAHVMMGLQFLLLRGVIQPLQLTCNRHTPNQAQYQQLLQGVIGGADQEKRNNMGEHAQHQHNGPPNYAANTPITECIVCNRTLGKYDYERPFIYFKDDKSHTRVFTNHTVAELLVEFFRYYAFEFSYLNDCVSIRLGHPIRREAKDWSSGRSTATRDPYGFAAGLCIEDPFEIEYNLSSNANRWEIAGLRWEYERAYHALLSGRGFAGACIPWKAWDPARFYDFGIYNQELITSIMR